jgi:hypothetical protein
MQQMLQAAHAPLAHRQLQQARHGSLRKQPADCRLLLHLVLCLCVWLQDDSVLYTASGDQRVAVWDTDAGRLKSYCCGHEGSAKVVAPHTTAPDIFASGVVQQLAAGAAGQQEEAPCYTLGVVSSSCAQPEPQS